jgi:predicted metal-dependent enzyme (double-stranded beta helix superfamily)
MTTTRYTLDEFIHDMTALVAAQPDQARLFDKGTAYIERFVRDEHAIPEEFRRPAINGRRKGGGSYVLHRGPGLLVTTVVWGPGAHVGPHDHHTWGMIGVVGNGIQETRYRRVDDRDRDGYATLVEDRTALVRPGEVSLLVPEVDEIHAMDNRSDRPTVELHVYGTDLVGLDRCQYNLETGAIQRFTSGKFDNC